MYPILQDCVLERIANDAVAGTSDITSSVIDMTGFDGALIFAALGDVTSTCALTLTVKENTANSTSSPAPTAVAGGALGPFTAGATDHDNGIIAIDVVRPAQRYLFAVLNRTTANAVVDGIFALKYRARNVPVAQDATVVHYGTSTPEV
jgi:hypothetical protein